MFISGAVANKKLLAAIALAATLGLAAKHFGVFGDPNLQGFNFEKIKDREKETNATITNEMRQDDLRTFQEILEELKDKTTEELQKLLEKAIYEQDVLLESVIYTLLLRRGVKLKGFFHFFFIENGEGWEVIVVRDDSEDPEKDEEVFALTDEIMTTDTYIASVSVSLSEGEFVVHHQDDDGELITHISVTQRRATEEDDLAPDEDDFRDEIIFFLEKMGFKPGTSDNNPDEPNPHNPNNPTGMDPNNPLFDNFWGPIGE